MLHGSGRRHDEGDDRKVIYLEFVAASSILFIVALVLYMVFTYQPV
jgi:hypothetical protein